MVLLAAFLGAFVDLVDLATFSLAIGLTVFALAVAAVVVFAVFDADVAIAVPVKRKAAAVIDASSFIKIVFLLSGKVVPGSIGTGTRR